MKKIGLMCMLGLAMTISMLCGVAGAESKPVMVVATFDAKGFTQEDIEFVMNIFTSNFANMGFADIVDRSSFDKIKKELSFQDSDWSDSNKVAELGRALNANQVATGQLTKRGANIFFTVKILDVNTTKIIASHLDKMKSIDEFFDKMPEFCNTLIGKAGGKSSFSASTSRSRGTLEISTITPCSIFVEGHEVASLNAFGECSISCDVGMRDIEIRYEDKHVEKKNVMVKKEGISSIREKYVSKDVADKCYALGEEAHKNNDMVGASRWYKLAADGGNASAMCDIARFYQNGLGGLKKDEVEALKWFRKAAEGGEPMSMIWVGYYYEYGCGGLRKNQKEAIKWYKLAAKAEDEDISEFAIEKLEELGQ